MKTLSELLCFKPKTPEVSEVLHTPSPIIVDEQKPINILSGHLRKLLDLPKMRPTGGLSTDDSNPKMEQFANPLYKMLVSAQLDGVSIENSSLLQRQYDEEFGVVDPASDIHTDVHLLNDALLRRARENKVSTAKSKETNE